MINFKKIKVFFILTTTFITISGCVNKYRINNDIDYIIYGTYGYYSGAPDRMFKLDGEKLLIDTYDLFYRNPQDLSDADGKILKPEEFDSAKALIEKIPALLLSAEDTVFGYPGNDDLGGIYFQIRVNGTLKTSYIDKEKSAIPKELWGYVDLIEKMCSIPYYPPKM